MIEINPASWVFLQMIPNPLARSKKWITWGINTGKGMEEMGRTISV